MNADSLECDGSPHFNKYPSIEKQMETRQSWIQRTLLQNQDDLRTFRQLEHNNAGSQEGKTADNQREQYRLVLSKLDSTTQELHALTIKHGELLAWKRRLELEVHNLSQARKEDKQEISDLKKQLQEEILKGNLTNETLNRLHAENVKKNEALIAENENLHKRCASLMTSHMAAISKLELAQEWMNRLKKQYEDSIRDRNVAIDERNTLQSKVNDAMVQHNSKCMAFLMSEIQKQDDRNEVQARTKEESHDIKRLIKELNTARREHSLIMREREEVHNELGKLERDLWFARKKAKLLEKENQSVNDENGILRQQVEYFRSKILQSNKTRAEKAKMIFSIAENPRHYHVSAVQHSTDAADSVTSTEEKLKQQLSQMQMESLMAAIQQVNACKEQRDAALQERDQVILEREALRALCDVLRKERDQIVARFSEVLSYSNNDTRRNSNSDLSIMFEMCI